ncbi:MAG TPA: NAD+ synthase [bacterium]|nr:NAD+ synthase [bacterium]
MAGTVLRIAMGQINPTVGDLERNADKIVRAVEKARAARADLVMVPELCLCGYPPEDLLLKPAFLQDCKKALNNIVPRVAGITVVIGFPELAGRDVFNAAAVVSAGKIAAIYRKVELPNYGVFDEKRYFTAGTECALFALRGARVMLTICEDIWIEGGRVEKWARARRAGVVLNISGSPFDAGKLDLRRKIVTGFARRTGAAVCYNNLAGAQDELVFDGGSLVALPSGRIIAMARRFEEDLLVTDLEVPAGTRAAAKSAGKKKSMIILPAPAADGRGLVAPSMCRELSKLEEVYLALVTGTGDYVTKNGFAKVVIGLSGGVDSSLVAALAVKALGRDNVIGVTMPSQYTSGETFSDAELLAKNLGIRLITVPIKDVFIKFMAELKQALGEGGPGVEAENLQARIRGNILMALSNRFGWLVLTTGNKSETAVGYCTLYGDMAGGFAVIKDVPKTLVWELARHVNRGAGRELIPESVIARPPTAELRPGQKDEDSLPPYPVLDPILEEYVEEDRALDQIVAAGLSARTVREVIALVDRNEYKRRQAPPGVKITPKAFGRDRRLPITNRYRPR